MYLNFFPTMELTIAWYFYLDYKTINGSNKLEIMGHATESSSFEVCDFTWFC